MVKLAGFEPSIAAQFGVGFPAPSLLDSAFGAPP
jgi:hypothetical protein